MKKKNSLKSKLNFILAMTISGFLLHNSQIMKQKNVVFAQSAKTISPVAVKNLAEDILPQQWDKIKSKIDKDKPTIILGAGGGFGLDDPYKYDMTKYDLKNLKTNYNIDKNEVKSTTRKMNDFTYILLYKLAEQLASYNKFNILLVNNADDTIVEVKNKKNEFPTLLSDIQQNSDGTYDHYYGAKNQIQAIKYVANKIGEMVGWPYDYDETTYIKKYKIPEKSIAFVSLQTNETDTHDAEGFEAYFNSADKNGELLTKNVTQNCRFLISKNPRAAIDDKEALGYASADEKQLPKLGKFGVETLLAFVDHTDNIKTQSKFWSTNLIERMATGMARSIAQHFGFNPTYADTAINVVTKNGLTGFLAKTNLAGDDLQNFSSGYVKISRADEKFLNENDKPKQTTPPEEFKEVAFNQTNTVLMSTAFIPDLNPNLEGKTNYEKEENNEFVIEVFAKDKNTGEFKLIPSNVTNFKVTLNSNKEPIIQLNEVYENKLMEKIEKQTQKKQNDLQELKAAIEKA